MQSSVVRLCPIGLAGLRGPWRDWMRVCTRVRSHLADFLARGERKIDLWYASLSVVEVAFDDEAEAFANINTRAELAQHERR